MNLREIRDAIHEKALADARFMDEEIMKLLSDGFGLDDLVLQDVDEWERRIVHAVTGKVLLECKRLSMLPEL